MKQTFYLFLFLAMLGKVSAQTHLTGYVTIQNSGKKSAYPTQIQSFGASDTDVGSTDGYFKLIYNRKSPGSDVELSIEKRGYEVVNKEILNLRLPHPSDLRKDVKIYLCKKGEWRKNANKFYAINLKEISKSHRIRIKELEKKKADALIANDDYRRALVQYEKQKQIAEAQAENLAERFAKANIDDASERFKKAYRLFSEGKIDSVLIVLDEEILLADLKKIENEIAQAKKIIDQGDNLVINGEKFKNISLEKLKLLAHTKAKQQKWVEANRLFLLCVAKDNHSMEIIDEHVQFLYLNSLKSRDVFDTLHSCDYLISYIDIAIKKDDLDWIENAHKWHRYATALIPFHANDFNETNTPKKNALEIELDRQKITLNNY